HSPAPDLPTSDQLAVMISPVDSQNASNLTGQVSLSDLRPQFMGNYSSVFRRIVKGNQVRIQVAIKIIKSTGAPHTIQRKILREITVWSSVDHPNILPFYGYTEDTVFGPFDAPFGALISPWCGNGDSSKFMAGHGESLTIRDRIKLWRGVVDAVVYLHQRQPTIVHGDLKPGNVLIDDGGRPRICDFGLSQVFFDQPGSGMTTTTEHTGTERYLAPELLVEDADIHPTTASDVHAMGCLGLEFIYLQRPYSHRKNNLRGVIVADIKKGVAPAAESVNPPSPLWLLVQSCWKRQPDLRPTASTISSALRISKYIVPTTVAKQI
ncbi:hypothetical protein M408DRAFT_321312, partial [Serendipita vermifera MAFF 305830]